MMRRSVPTIIGECSTLAYRKIRQRGRPIRLRSFVLIVTLLTCLRLFEVSSVVFSTLSNLGRKSDFLLLDEFDDGTKGKSWNAALARRGRTVRRLNALSNSSPPCPRAPEGLIGQVDMDLGVAATSTYSELLVGGRFSPRDCTAGYKVAIIIPLRDRESQLRTLLSHMHPIWQRQQIDYTVYVVTQAGDELFNRAKLMNIGVAEAEKDREYDCYVFQDTDLLLEDDRCLYWCDNENPRHLARHVDTFSYEILSYRLDCMPGANPFSYVQGFGGVSMLTKEQFDAVNGYSNLYWGWGGEDDDMYLRLGSKGFSVTNSYGRMCSFSMIRHEHESTNAANQGRNALLYHAISRAEQEGFNTLRYRLLTIHRTPLYTNVTVDIGKPSKRMKDFMSLDSTWISSCWSRMPWNI